MPEQERSPRARLLDLIVAFQKTQCIRVAVELGLPDLLAEHPTSATDLAQVCGVDPPMLRRFLRALIAIGLIELEDDGRYALTSMGRALGSDDLGPVAIFYGSDPTWSVWSALGNSIRTGQQAFDRVYGNPDCWEYYAENPRAAIEFDAAMASLTGGTSDAVVDSFDFGRFHTVVDVGGGDGTLLTTILRRHPQVRGVLYDVAHVADRAHQALGAAGVADRCEVRSGDFRVEVPTGGDCYVLKWIVHDWDDDGCRAILGACRRAMDERSRLVLVERVLPEKTRPGNTDGPLADLMMLVMANGKERTEQEFAELLAECGFRLDRIQPTGTNVNVLEAVPV
jgi:hypothetical protein